MDTAGLARAQRKAAKSHAVSQSLESSNAETSTTTNTEAENVSGSQRISSDSADGGGGPPQRGAGELDAAEFTTVTEDNVVVTDQGVRQKVVQGKAQEDDEEEDGAGLDQGATKLEMVPMGAVGHLGRRDKLAIIRKTVAKEKRMVVLQRLFHLAQGECPSPPCRTLFLTVLRVQKRRPSYTQVHDSGSRCSRQHGRGRK